MSIGVMLRAGSRVFPNAFLHIFSGRRPCPSSVCRLALAFGCLWFLLSAWPVLADGPAFNDRLRLGAGQDATTALATGDVDGDGDLDLIVGNTLEQSAVYLNDGRGGFYDGALGNCDSLAQVVRCFGAGSERPAALAMGDLNGDGDLDIVVGTDGQGGRVYLNTGGGRFVQTGLFGPGSGRIPSLALGDLDGDNDLDIVVGGQQAMIYLNDGVGGFHAGALGNCATLPEGTRCFGGGASLAAVALGDVNGDGWPDIAAISADSGLSAVYLNDGTAGFSEVRPDRCAEPAQSGRMLCLAPGNPGALQRAALGDINGQGGLDIVVLAPGQAPLAYLNTGQGGFEAPRLLLPPVATTSAPGGEEAGAPPAPTGEAAGLSLALADLDTDGVLDVIVGSTFDQNLIYLSDGSGGVREVVPFGPGLTATTAIAAADLDGDGDLDLAVGNRGQRNAIYWNDGGGAYPVSAILPGAFARALVLGDLDLDGSQDILAGGEQGHRVLLNDGAGRFTEALAFGRGQLSSLAIGDVDGDRDLDLIASYDDASGLVYLNQYQETGRLAFAATDQPLGPNAATALALGDLDGDGDLDLVTGRDSRAGEPQHVYLNDGRGRFTQRPLGAGKYHTRSVALGDLDGDGDLDVVAGNQFSFWGERQTLYFNGGAGNFDAPAAEQSLPGDPDNTNAVAVGDVDGDGDTDIVVGNGGFGDRQNLLYLNDGAGGFDASRYIGTGKFATTGLALGDVDGDGDLDLAAAHSGGRSSVYLNDGKGNFAVVRDLALTDRAGGRISPGDLAALVRGAGVLALGDLDGDGDNDFVSGGPRRPILVTLNPLQQGAALPNQPPFVSLSRPDGSADAGSYGTALVLSEREIAVPYTLFDPEGDPIRRVEVMYSANGGGQWLAAAAVTRTVTTTLATIPYPAAPISPTHVYTWDTLTSGFFDQSDQVVLRIKAYSGGRPVRYGLPDAGQRPYASATTGPVRVLGTQVQVFRETESISNTVAGAYVFRLPAGRLSGGELLGNSAGVAYRTNQRGFLQGGGQIAPGDRLVALWPVTSTYSYTVYYSSAAPIEGGLAAHEVTEAGVQKLIVSQDRPLVLFNLDVSLEWDARNDGSFVNDLTEAIRRASEMLFDVTDGQMALGGVRIFQNKENWLESDVVIFANSSVRPRATMGGIVDRPTDDVVSASKVIREAFWPGQIRMGPAWDPFGENRTDLGRDWWRALAHEFGHYLLYLPDNYLGYDPVGFIKSVDCRYSFMTNTYDDDYSEFMNAAQWGQAGSNCAQTIAAYLTGRSDWQTITQYYPMVRAGGTLWGPAVLPLDVTQIRLVTPSAPASVLPARYFDLRDAVQQQRQIVAQGQGYLFQTQGTPDLRDDRVVPLGSTARSDRLRVRGAAAGDRVCVFDESHIPPRWGCQDNLTALSSTLYLQDAPGWAPNVAVAPVALPDGAAVVTRTIPVTNGAALATSSALTPAPIMGPVAREGVITPAQLLTPTQIISETVNLFRPGLTITVTLAQPVQRGRLNLQVLPAYEPPGTAKPITAPWVTVNAVTPVRPITFTQVISLEARFYSGFVRVWVNDAAGRVVQESVSQFFTDPAWGQDNFGGAWVESRGGLGVESRGGLGVESRGGLGVESRGGLGVESRGGLGVESRGGLGVESRGGLGVESRGGLGVESRGGLGVESRGGLGVESRGGLGVESRGGLGVESRGGLGVESRGGLGAEWRAMGANRRALGAPIASSDGQVTIFNRSDVLGATGTASLQALAIAPNLSPWLTTVGQTYRFVATTPISRTIAFSYLQREVPPGYEHTLKIYYSPDEGQTWQHLPSTLDSEENMAIAAADGSGLYALVASVEIPLYSTGWNLFAFPVPETRPVTEALRSIDAAYRTIYTYDSRDAADPWKVYDKDAPDWVNDLPNLEYGHGYWINISAPITIQLRVAGDVDAGRPALSVGAGQLSEALGRRSPPAIYFGMIDGTSDRLLAPDMMLTAWIDGEMCGQAGIQQTDEALRYVIKVVAGEPGTPYACGAPGKRIVFTFGNQVVGPAAAWDNRRPTRWDIRMESSQQAPTGQ